MLTIYTTCQYSRDGNLIQTTDRNGVSTTYVWGHGGVFLLAKIMGATHLQVGNIAGLDRLDEYTRSGNLTQTQIDALYALSNTQVSVYEYAPFIGVTRTIDPSGRKSYYTYDADGKLSGIADDKGQTTTQYEYHISNQ